MVQVIHLNGSHVSFEPDNFSDEFIVANSDKLVHGSSGHLLGRNDRPGHRVDVAVHALTVLISDQRQVLQQTNKKVKKKI